MGEESGEGRLGRCPVNGFNCLRLGRLTRGRETGNVSSRSGRHSWGSSWTLRGCLKKAHVRGGGIRYVLVYGWTERGESFATDRTGAIERGMLIARVDAERGGGIATSYHRLLEASFRTALVSTSVGGTVVEEGADWAGLCLFFAHGSRVTKSPALPALGRLGGGVGRSDRGGTGEEMNSFAENGKHGVRRPQQQPKLCASRPPLPDQTAGT